MLDTLQDYKNLISVFFIYFFVITESFFSKVPYYCPTMLTLYILKVALLIKQTRNTNTKSASRTKYQILYRTTQINRVHLSFISVLTKFYFLKYPIIAHPHGSTIA